MFRFPKKIPSRRQTGVAFTPAQVLACRFVEGEDMGKCKLCSQTKTIFFTDWLAAILVDDRPRYHLSQPTRGLLVPGFRMDDVAESSLLQCVPVLLRCIAAIRPPMPANDCARAVATVLVPAASREYWDGLALRAASVLRKSKETADGALTEWGKRHHIPDTVWMETTQRMGKTT